MAKATMKLPTDFLLKISRLAERTDEIVPRVLQAGGEVLQTNIKSSLEAVIGTDTKEDSRSTGQLVSSLGVSTARQDMEGNFNVKVGFADSRSDGKSNGLIAGVLEYGKHGQPAKPFLAPAKAASRKGCIKAMKAKLDSEVNGV